MRCPGLSPGTTRERSDLVTLLRKSPKVLQRSMGQVRWEPAGLRLPAVDSWLLVPAQEALYDMMTNTYECAGHYSEHLSGSSS